MGWTSASVESKFSEVAKSTLWEWLEDGGKEIIYLCGGISTDNKCKSKKFAPSDQLEKKGTSSTKYKIKILPWQKMA
jgi:hypothetical protein